MRVTADLRTTADFRVQGRDNGEGLVLLRLAEGDKELVRLSITNAQAQAIQRELASVTGIPIFPAAFTMEFLIEEVEEMEINGRKVMIVKKFRPLRVLPRLASEEEPA